MHIKQFYDASSDDETGSSLEAAFNERFGPSTNSKLIGTVIYKAR